MCFLDGNIKTSFKIESRLNKGYIYTNKLLDREDRAYFELLIRASNRATSYNLNTKRRKKRAVEDASATVVKIYVMDVNDNTPVFVLPDYRACKSLGLSPII
jgi:hypothetical protein